MAEMLDPNWTPQAGYAHATSLMSIGQASGKSLGLAQARQNQTVAHGTGIVYDVHVIENNGRSNVTDRDESMAPKDLSWHRLYVRNMMEIGYLLDELQNHPAMQDAEDLGDWVEAFATMHSFRPQTRDDIELEVRTEWTTKRYGEQGKTT